MNACNTKHEPITGVWGRRPQRGPRAEPLAGHVAESFLYTFVQKMGQKVKDLNESKVCTFVLLNWPIVLSELDVTIVVRFNANDTN